MFFKATLYGYRLQGLMKRHKITGAALGNAIGVSQKTISRYCNGDTQPTQERQNEIERALQNVWQISDKEIESLYADKVCTIREAKIVQDVLKESQEEFDEQTLDPDEEDWMFDEEEARMHSAEFLLCYIFGLLPERNQRFFLKHFFEYCALSANDVILAEYLQSDSVAERKQYILKQLQTVELLQFKCKAKELEQLQPCLHLALCCDIPSIEEEDWGEELQWFTHEYQKLEGEGDYLWEVTSQFGSFFQERKTKDWEETLPLLGKQFLRLFRQLKYEQQYDLLMYPLYYWTIDNERAWLLLLIRLNAFADSSRDPMKRYGQKLTYLHRLRMMGGIE